MLGKGDDATADVSQEEQPINSAHVCSVSTKKCEFVFARLASLYNQCYQKAEPCTGAESLAKLKRPTMTVNMMSSIPSQASLRTVNDRARQQKLSKAARQLTSSCGLGRLQH